MVAFCLLQHPSSTDGCVWWVQEGGGKWDQPYPGGEQRDPECQEEDVCRPGKTDQPDKDGDWQVPHPLGGDAERTRTEMCVQLFINFTSVTCVHIVTLAPGGECEGRAPEGSARVGYLGLFVCLHDSLLLRLTWFVYTRRNIPVVWSSSKMIRNNIQIWTQTIIKGFFTIAR